MSSETCSGFWLRRKRERELRPEHGRRRAKALAAAEITGRKQLEKTVGREAALAADIAFKVRPDGRGLSFAFAVPDELVPPEREAAFRAGVALGADRPAPPGWDDIARG